MDTDQNKGWIKLHRKVLDNGILKDQIAWVIFCWLLLRVDRKTGKTTLGRIWASKELGIKPTTFYKALKRLENIYKTVSLVTKKVTIKYTEVSVLNWYKYQQENTPVTQESNNPVTIKGQSSNNPVTHIQEEENIRSKEIEKYIQLQQILLIPENLEKLKIQFPLVNVDMEIEKMVDWRKNNHKKIIDYMAFARNWLRSARPTKERVIHL